MKEIVKGIQELRVYLSDTFNFLFLFIDFKLCFFFKLHPILNQKRENRAKQLKIYIQTIH